MTEFIQKYQGHTLDLDTTQPAHISIQADRRHLLERLEILLRSDADNPNGVSFDLGYWGAPRDEVMDCYSLLPSKTLTIPTEISCGTVACACGLAALDPFFQSQGLRLAKHPQACWAVISFEGLLGFDAAAKFFGIDRETAHFLFDSGRYGYYIDGSWNTPEIVAREGELLVADRIRFVLENATLI